MTNMEENAVEQEPVVVWEAPNQLEAQIVAGRLQSEGIPAMIQGESAGTVFGFSTGGLAEAEVLVPAALADKAFAILDADVELDEDDVLVDEESASEKKTGDETAGAETAGKEADGNAA